jgi:ubiquinone/menaquinone biosynthesis C-methylase UbiE
MPHPARPLLAFLFLLTACPPTMVERDGHRVFNPFYTGILEARDRDEWQQSDRVMDALGLGEGSIVADVGAASGWFSERFSGRVGATGRVYATDVQDVMIERLRERVSKRGLHNVEVVHAAFDDPTLPDACCDVIFFASVYKEIDERIPYMRKVAQALRADGRLAILEYRPDARGQGPPRDMRLDPGVVIDELRRAGFALVARHEFIDRQFFLVFAPLR